MSWITADANGVVLTIKATPSSSNDGVAGVEGEWLRVRLRAPPVDGKANAALVRWLAGWLGVPRQAVEMVSGSTARIKRVRVRGVSAAAVTARLGQNV